MKKKTFASIAILLTLAQGAWAKSESVTFNVRSWYRSEVVTSPVTWDKATVLEGDHSEGWLGLGAKDNYNEHYYVVKGNVSFKTLNCFGRVRIILADDATLTCSGGIIVQKSNNNSELYIYSQSDGDHEGKLIVTNTYEGAAGIGSTWGEDNGTIEIHGGKLDVKGAKKAAGIGAGYCTETRSTNAGKITIYGGVVKAEGGDCGAAIGGGSGHDGSQYDSDGFTIHPTSDGADFTLYGGVVTAIGGEYAAGVGGGGGYDKIVSNAFRPGGDSGKCKIYGGTLTAQGGYRGAGIGSGNKDGVNYLLNHGEIYISGGTVTSTGGKYAAGIGGGCSCSAGTIVISGGTVTSIGGIDGAGIGGGESGGGGTITIKGGNVRAEGRSYGAGIGSGEVRSDLSVGADLTITGGTVIAIAGGDCNARENKGGSAIGCGQGESDKDNIEKAKSLNLPDNYKVTAGDAENNIERVFTNGERVPACRWRNYVKIEPCSHETPTVGSDLNDAITYTIDDDEYHTKHCRYCNYTEQEMHSETTTCICGKSNYIPYTVYKTGSEKDTYEMDFLTIVGVGLKFYLPSCSNIPDGYIFKGWAMNPDPEDNKWEARLGEDIKDVGESVKTILGQSPTKFYPRFLYDYLDTWTWSANGTSCSVKLTCAALPETTYSSEEDDNLIISEPEDLTNEQGETIGKRYNATLTIEKNGYEYKFSSHYDVMNKLTLYDNRDNWDALYDARGVTMQQVVLNGRTLWKDGSWNTLYLPFKLDNTEGTPFEGATIMKISKASFINGTLNLEFDEVNKINSGTPYLVKWDKPESYVPYNGTNANACSDIVNPTFQYVTIEGSLLDHTFDLGDGKFVSFVGTYKPVSLQADDRSVLYLGADNMLYYPAADMTIGAQRAIFKLVGLTMGDPESGQTGINAFVLNFGDGNETGITTTNCTNYTDSDNAWYSLDGRKLSDKPTVKGIYINNGRKVVIK